MSETHDNLREAVALTYEEAEKLALQAIHGADGRGMIGRGRNHLHQRVARAILQAHRAALPALSVPEGWQPIETAPRDGTDLLVYWPRMKIDDAGNLTGEQADGPGWIGVSRNEFGGWEPDSVVEANGDWFDDDFEFGEPTHWMPLPAPPLSAIPSPGGVGSPRPWPQPVAQTTAIPPLLDQGDTTTLLEALKGLYDACEYRANREGGDFGPDIGPAAEAARAAIAQANASPSPSEATARPLSAPDAGAGDETNKGAGEVGGVKPGCVRRRLRG